VKAGNRRHTGTTVLPPDDDPVARSRTLPHQWDAAIGRLMASSPLTIRIDLDPGIDVRGSDHRQWWRRAAQR
jgi:hypothetical protein